MTYDELLAHYPWREIPNCPGRFTLVTPRPDLGPSTLAHVEYAAAEFRVPNARDLVIVLPAIGGGLISYRRNNGSHLHTLCDESGFRRKLEQLEIDL